MPDHERGTLNVEKQKAMSKVISVSSEVTCTLERRLQWDADPQLRSPPKWRKPLSSKSMVVGSTLCICNAA